MSQVLSGPASRVTAEAAVAVAWAIETPPGALTVLHDLPWPMRDPESLRGVGLLVESRLSGESAERLRADHARLFTGAGRRAPTGVPAAAAAPLTRLYEQVTAAGVALPDGAGVTQALRGYAALLAEELPAEAVRWRRRLLHDHLLTWGTRCLTRLQLGAQTFYYQGVATVGLGLLRWADAQH